MAVCILYQRLKRGSPPFDLLCPYPGTIVVQCLAVSHHLRYKLIASGTGTGSEPATQGRWCPDLSLIPKDAVTRLTATQHYCVQSMNWQVVDNSKRHLPPTRHRLIHFQDFITYMSLTPYLHVIIGPSHTDFLTFLMTSATPGPAIALRSSSCSPLPVAIFRMVRRMIYCSMVTRCNVGNNQN